MKKTNKTRSFYDIIDSKGDVVGEILLEKKWVKIVSDMLKIYPDLYLEKQ